MPVDRHHTSTTATNGTHATHDDNAAAIAWFKRVNDLFKTKVPGTHNLVRGVSAPTNAAAPPVNLPPLPPLKTSTAKSGLPRRPLAAKGLPGSGGSSSAATTTTATATSAAKKARPSVPVAPPPVQPTPVAAAPVTGKRERGASTTRSAAAAQASSSVADDREDGEVADHETAVEATEWLKRESKRAEADKSFAEIVGVASPKRARHSPRPGDSAKPVRAAKAAAAIAVTKSSSTRAAAAAAAVASTATAATSTAAATAATLTPLAVETAPPVTTRSSASARTRSAVSDTGTTGAAATTTTSAATPALTDKQRRDSLQLQAKKLKHLGDATLKDAPDMQDRKEAYQSLLSAGLLWLEVVSLSDEPRPLLKQTADYFSYHIGNLDALPRYASCFLRCRAVTLAQLARCQQIENGKAMCAQAKKQIDGARRELKAHPSDVGSTLRKLVAADGAAEQVMRQCDAVYDAREKWARATQLWQAEGGAPLAWPGDGDFLAMALPDFVDFVRKNLAQLLGE